LPARRIADALRTETIGGILLIVAAVIGLVWANTPWASAYTDISQYRIGYLSLAGWAAEGLLAIFFFVAGLELKREFVVGDLRDPKLAVLPIAAAVGGMAVPALIYTLVNLGGAVRGWAIPSATDIAFALAVLAVMGKHLPPALRTFLLTLAVVDDLLAIVIIAVFYTASLHVLWLLLALVPLALFALAARRYPRTYLLLPLAVATWALVHESGVHATVAGVLLAFTVPVATAEGFEHRWRPVSAGIAVPVFAFFAAGVSISGGLGASLRDAITIGVICGLVLGKTIGITAATWLVQRLTRAELAEELRWPHVIGLGMLGGVGFTVSLLIGELAFGAGTEQDDHAKIGVLLGSVISAVLAAVLLNTMRHGKGRPSGRP
jgi:NhaA family Na+:H+ antiporter